MGRQLQKMTNLDYHFLISELQPMVGGHLGKIYELDTSTFRFKVRADKEYNFIAQLGLRANLSRYVDESPEKPSNFAMLLRKYLDNAQIVAIRQEDDDRVFSMLLRKKEEFRLIFEMFAKGNLILTDADGKIIGAYRLEVSKSRTIKTSGIYASLPNKNRLGEIPEKEPAIYLVEGKPVGFSSMPTGKFPNSEKKSFPSICDMADEYYRLAMQSAGLVERPEGKSKNAPSAPDNESAPSIRKIEFTLRQQIAALKKFEKEVLDFQVAGNFIYANFELIEKVLKISRELRRQKAADKDIEKALGEKMGLLAKVSGDKLILDVEGKGQEIISGEGVDQSSNTPP